MKGYITRTTQWIKTEVLTCSHPKVEKIWFTGMKSMISDDKVALSLNILYIDGTHESFTEENVTTKSEENLIIKAEEHLLNVI